MLVCFIADINSASSRLRVLQYVDLLIAERVKVRVCVTRPSKYVPRPPRLRRKSLPLLLYQILSVASIISQRLWQILTVAPRARVVLLQKDFLFRSRLRFLERILFLVTSLRRIPVVFDIDDPIFLGSSDKPLPHMNSKTEYICKKATRILAGSEEIANHLSQYRAKLTVMPTRIRLDQAPKQRDEPSKGITRLVWTGTATNLKYVVSISAALSELSKLIPFQLEIVTRLADVPEEFLPNLPIRFTEWSEENELRALHNSDVGLAPLGDNDWCRSKCGARLLAYFRAALPVVASKVGVQAQMVVDGETGMIAATTDDWITCLLTLHENPALRRRLGRGGREFVENNFDAARRFPEWRDAILRFRPEATRSLTPDIAPEPNS
jgi:glycosyltransferase involved in cell wall biosynthesis